MFQFPAFALFILYIQMRVIPHYQDRVAPFGYLRVYGRLHLPEAFRSLPRPSSPVRA